MRYEEGAVETADSGEEMVFDEIFNFLSTDLLHSLQSGEREDRRARLVDQTEAPAKIS